MPPSRPSSPGRGRGRRALVHVARAALFTVAAVVLYRRLQRQHAAERRAEREAHRSGG